MEMRKTKTGRAANALPTEARDKDIWSEDKMEQLRDFILTESDKQTPDQKLRNEMLAITYQMEDYVQDDSSENLLRIVDFVRLYLGVLHMTQKDLATAFGMKDTNLYKYLTGERKLNTDLVLKLSAFTQTLPELWYYVQIRNELSELRKEKERMKTYEQYDYRKLMAGR